MNNYKYLISVLGILMLLLGYWVFYLKDIRENRLMNEANQLVKKIEAFKTGNNRLPNSLIEIGIKEVDGADVLYYNKRDSLNYTISFGTSLGESKFYYSDCKCWEDRYRYMNE